MIPLPYRWQLTDAEVAVLSKRCPRCGAPRLQWCTTKAGGEARAMHAARWESRR